MTGRRDFRALLPLVGLALLLGAVSGCKRDPPPIDRWSDDRILAEGARFLDDAAFRRSALVDSLTNPKNTYSQQRLTSYALGSSGWDLLPVWNPRAIEVDANIARGARERRPLVIPEGTPALWNGTRPNTMSEWVGLGRQVFFRYPLRAEPIIEWALAHPESAEPAGVKAAPDGSYPGLVAFKDIDGRARVGITCALCHTNVDAGEVIVGEARRAFDYGRLRLAYHQETGASVETTFAHRLHSWGPGRADVTEDDDEDPVAIPDLWGLRTQTYLTQAASIRHVSPVALAIRQETQLLTSNHQRIRPPRELAFALALALYALEPPRAAAAAPAAAANSAGNSTSSRAGEALFGKHCARCHSNPAGGGDAIAVGRVDTDPALANGTARGTGQYRPPSLIRVARAAPYFHDGSVATLEDVLAPERLDASFVRGALGKGPVRGHRFGTNLSAGDRAALVDYLRTR